MEQTLRPNGATFGHARFVDGTTRPVFADGERPYVIDEGGRVYGLFVRPEEDQGDAPILVKEARERKR